MSVLKKRAGTSELATRQKKMKPLMEPYANPPTLVHGEYTPEQLKATLTQHGYCVIKDVLTDAKVSAYREEFYDAYASLVDLAPDKTRVPLGLDPRQPETLTKEKIPPYKGNGIINVPGVGALAVCESVRADADVSAVFVAWHGTDELATSFDRSSLFAPGQQREGLAPHIDANPRRPEQVARERTIQSSVILTGSSSLSQGFVVWPGHHNNPAKWNRDGKAQDSNWCVIPEDRRDELGTGRIISAEAGSQIVWLSSTVHGNTSGDRSTRVGRVAIFVSKAPTALVSGAAWERIVQARLSQTTLSHEVITPASLPPGNGRFKNPINHRFAPQHFATYATADDIPEALMKKMK